jgi:hypothetical protein
LSTLQSEPPEQRKTRDHGGVLLIHVTDPPFSVREQPKNADWHGRCAKRQAALFSLGGAKIT